VETRQATGNTDTILTVLSSRQTYWYRRGTSHGQVLHAAWNKSRSQVTVKPSCRMLGRRMERKSPGLKVHRHDIPLPPLRTAVTRMCMFGSKPSDRSNNCRRDLPRDQRDLPKRPKRPTSDRTATDQGRRPEERYTGMSPQAVRSIDTIVMPSVLPPSPLRQGMQHRAAGFGVGTRPQERRDPKR
jgi:hypothetical protein